MPCCPNRERSSAIRMTFKSDGSSSFSTFRKIQFWGDDIPCTDKTSTVTKDIWAVEGTTVTFDLLAETTKDVAHPTLTITPCGCYQTTWELVRVSDSTNMVTWEPNFFTLTSPSYSATTGAYDAGKLNLSHTIMDYAMR